MNVSELACHMNVSELACLMNISELACRMNVSELACRMNVSELACRIQNFCHWKNDLLHDLPPTKYHLLFCLYHFYPLIHNF
jgi:dimeric dUTPase (all-alpha-NTP-PPase superfamily)